MHYFRNWTTAVTESAVLKQKNMETQLDALKNQVNPHFLFNSLNSLSSLIQSNPPRAVNFVHKLSGVYRYLLQSNDKDLVALKEEVAFLQAYLQLLQIRFGKALHYLITINSAYESHFIPPLTLQLLVENAVKHNIVSIDQPLSIEVYNVHDRLVVKNNLQKRRSPVVSHHIGLVNLLSRYSLVTKAEVEISETGESFVVNLPLIKTSLYEGIDH
jgi:LytS/YehU family sensor histidine kinase